jgi:hypothetical protein
MPESPWEILLQDTTGQPILLCNDPDGTPIFLSKWVWLDHILSRHPEVDSYKETIIAAIRHPDTVHPDPEDQRVSLFYKGIQEKNRPFPRARFLRVVVKYLFPPERQGQRTGLIGSVYFVDRIKHRG